MSLYMKVRSPGRSVPSIYPRFPADFFQVTWVNTLFYQLSLAFCKISILLLYMRLLVAYPRARRAAMLVLAIVIIYNILGFISTVTMCIPLEAYWNPFHVKGHCHPSSYMWAVIGLHIATDFLIFLLPIPVAYRMKLPLGQKIGLLIVFALGFLYDSLHPDIC